jgi:8-oxo-dGTP diphosphatase
VIDKCFQVTVKGLVHDGDGRVLLLREESGIWDLPGGRLEHGEELADCLVRECREEMGVAAELLAPLPVRIWTAQDKLGVWRLVLAYPLRLESFAFHRSEECVDHGFFDREGLRTLELTPQIRPLIALL